MAGADVASVGTITIQPSSLSSDYENQPTIVREEGLMDALKDFLVTDESDRSLRQDMFDIIEELTDGNKVQEIDKLDELEAKAGLKIQPQGWSSDGDPALLTDPVTACLHVPGINNNIFGLRFEQIIAGKCGIISGMSDHVHAQVCQVQLQSFLACVCTVTMGTLLDNVVFRLNKGINTKDFVSETHSFHWYSQAPPLVPDNDDLRVCLDRRIFTPHLF